MDKVSFVYNTFHRSLINDLIAGDFSTEIKEHLNTALSSHSPTSKRNVERFIRKNDKASESVVANPPELLLSAERVAEIELVKKVKVSDVADNIQDKKLLPCYIYLFTILAYLFDKAVYAKDEDDDSSDEDEEENVSEKPTLEQVETLIETTLDVIKNLQNHEALDISTINDETLRNLLGYLNKVIEPISSKPMDEDDTTEKTAADMLQNTKIGSLAKEISDELDFTSLKIEKPEDLLNSGENGLLTNIISKVGGKIHQKIEKGELKHEDLMQEAVSMLSMLGGGGKGGDAAANPAAAFMNNPMFKDIMKNMGGLGNLGNLANMMKSSDKTKSSNVRDRLRKKLNEKKRL